MAQAAPVAHRVAGRRRLDLDDLGAEVAEQRADVGAGEQLAELDHAQAGERTARHACRPALRSQRRNSAFTASAITTSAAMIPYMRGMSWTVMACTSS